MIRASDADTPFQIIFLTETARARGFPTYATEGSVAFDVRADTPEKLVLTPGERTVLSLGFKLWINMPGYGGFLFPRSGKSIKEGLVLTNTVGVIDTDYQGPWMLAVTNMHSKDCVIEPGERIAQCAIMPVLKGQQFVEVDDFYTNTVRGSGALGSSGRV